MKFIVRFHFSCLYMPRCFVLVIFWNFLPICFCRHMWFTLALYFPLLLFSLFDTTTNYHMLGLSVNDAFVMRQWGLHQGLTEDTTTVDSLGTFEKVKLIPDGAAHFTRGMGMLVSWDTERGFGERSWRYSMVR
jgi:hypothetical protein